MDLLELDERLEKDIKYFEKSLVGYETMMNEASTLKYTFENQTKELMAAYEEKIEQLNAKFIRYEELSSRSIKSFTDDYYEKVVTLFNDLELKKNTLELYLNKLSEAYEEKWKDIQIKNENNLFDLDEKVNEKISNLEEENKRALRNIIDALTVNKKEIFQSKEEVTESIIDEVYKLQRKNSVIDESIEAINDDISKIRRESERSLISLSAELFKETTRAEDKDRRLAKNMYIFMTISCILVIVLLIWR